MMIAYFPKPYPNEDFRSIIYRYHIRTGKTSFIETNEELFSVKSKRNIYFHHNIGELVKLLNQENYSINYFLNNHTIFPLLEPFLPNQRKQRFLQGLGIYDTLKDKKIFKEYISKVIKYCPKCMEEDYKKFGEVYSHQYHQLNFLNSCDTHKNNLIFKCPECGVLLSDKDGLDLLSSPFCKNGHCLINNEVSYTNYSHQTERLCKDIHYLISNSHKLNRNLIINLCYLRLGKRGYGKIYSDIIEIKRLKSDFTSFVSLSHELLGVKSTIIINSQFNMMLTPKSVLMPNLLAILLLIQFLSNSIEDFFTNDNGFSIDLPFKNKQQPCLNKICGYYNHLIIKTYKKNYYPTYVQGTFLCPYCGYTYGRKWIWEKDKQSGKEGMPFLISRGELWEKEVLALYYQGLSLKAIATKIGLGTNKDPIVKFLKSKLGDAYEERFNPKTNLALYNINSRLDTDNSKYEPSINEIKKGIAEIATTTYEEQLLVLRRKNIINIINKNPNIKRTDIEKLARADYRWLRSNDQKWFEENLPIPKK